MSGSSSSEVETLYEWACHAGLRILERLEQIYGEKDKAVKRLHTWLLILRSEELPSRFRKQLVNIIVETEPRCVSLPREVSEERAWSIDEYYRYSTAILAGLYNAINDKCEKKRRERCEQGA